MAFPTMGAPTTQQVFSGNTTHNVNMPGTVASGRMLIVFFSSSQNVTTPSGWTLKKKVTAGTVQLNAYTRITDGTEGGTTVNFVTAAADLCAAHVYYASDASYNDTICFAVSTGATGTSTGPDPDSLTSGFGSVDTTWIAACVAPTSGVSGFPSSYGNTASTWFAYGVMGTADRDVNGSSQNPGAFTIDSSVAWAAITVGIRVNTTTPAVITSVTPDEFDDAETGVVVGGTGFLSPQSTGKVYLGDNSDYSIATKVEQTVTSWATTSITVTIDKGSFSYGGAYLFVLNSDGNVSNGWPVTLVEAPIALSDPAGVGGCRLGLEVYDVGGSTPIGIVTTVIEADTDEQISKLYGWSAKVPATARNADLLTKAREVAIIRETEGEVFRGRIESRLVTLAGDAKETEISGPSIDVELSDAFTYEGLLLDGETPSDAYDAAVALTEETWTTDVDVAAPSVSRRYDDASATNVRLDLDNIFHAYSRLTTTLRELNVRSASRETGIRLIKREAVGPELLGNPAIGLIDSMKITDEAFNLWNRIVPFGSSKTVLNGVRFGIGLADRSSPYTIAGRINATPSLTGVGGSGGIVSTPLPPVSVAVEGLNTALIVLVHVDGSNTIDACNTVLANGALLTQRDLIQAGSKITQVFYLQNPPRGQLSVEFGFNSTNSTKWEATIWSLRDVFQEGDPIRAVASATGSSTAPSVAVTSAANDFVIDQAALDSAPSSQTPGSGQTSASVPVVRQIVMLESYEAPGGASSTTMNWTLGTSKTWMTVAVSVKPSTSFYIEDSASVSAYGRRTRALIFSDFQNTIGDPTEAANTLYEKAVDYLQKHKDGTAFYECTVSYLAQGARAWNIGDSLRVEYQDAELGIDIDDMLVCVGRKAHYDSDGVRRWTLTLADVFRTPEDDAQVIASLASDVQSLRFNQV